MHMHSFASLIRRTPLPTFSDTAITTLIPLFSSSELTGCGYPSLLDRKNRLNDTGVVNSPYIVPSLFLKGNKQEVCFPL